MFHWAFVNGAVAIVDFFFSEIRLAGNAIQTGIGVEFDIASVVTRLQEFGDTALVAIFGCANEVVVPNVEFVPSLSKKRSDGVGEFLRCYTLGIGGLLNFEAMFVGAGEEVDVVAREPVPASQGIGNDGGVCVAEVRLRIDVINGGCQRKSRHNMRIRAIRC